MKLFLEFYPIMNRNVTGYWHSKKGKLKKRFPALIDSDLNYREGKEKEMIEVLGNKLGKSKQELISIIIGL